MKKLKFLIGIFIIAVITSAAFFSCIENGFFNWDDPSYVAENPFIRHISLSNFKKIFTSFFVSNYHPLTMFSFLLEYRFFGSNPAGYHLISVILHVANTLLVFWLVYVLVFSFPVALLTAFFFGVHPLHVESVAWISARKDLLYALFFIGTMICYCLYLRSQRSLKYYSAAIILFVLSLLSKAMALTLPLVLFLLDYLSRRKTDKTAVNDKIPFFIFSVIFGVIAVMGQYSSGAVRNENLFDFFYRASVAGYSIIFYLSKIFFPANLSCLYPFEAMNEYFFFTLSLAVAALLLALVVLTARYTRKILFGALFFIITLFPVLQFIPIGETIVADRYMYIPSLGIFFLVAEGFVWFYEKKNKFFLVKRGILFLIIGLTILGAAKLTRDRCKVWENSFTLWSDVLDKYPDVATAYNGRGVELLNMGEYKRAYSDLIRAVELNPGYYRAYSNLGMLFSFTGNDIEAIKFLNKAIAINPEYAIGYCNLCGIYAKAHNFKDALSACKKALEINPDIPLANMYLSTVYYFIGEYGLAVEYCRRASRLGYKVREGYMEQLKSAFDNQK